MERHRPHALRAANPERCKPLAQLARRLVGKGHRQNRPRRRRFDRAQTDHPRPLLRGGMLRIAFEECKILLACPLRHLPAVAAASVGQQVCHAVDQYGRLAASRAGEQQQRSLRGQHAFPLLRVQFLKIPRDRRPAGGDVTGLKIVHFGLTFSSHSF